MSPPALQRATELIPELADVAARTDASGAFPAESIRALHRCGLLSAVVPADDGGEGLAEPCNMLALLQTLAAIGHGHLAVGRLYEGHVNALRLIADFGDPAQQQRAAADAAAGHLFGVWNTQADDGVTLAPTRAGGVLQGRKTFASGLGHVSRAVVTAAVEQGAGATGWQMLLLSTDVQPPGIDPSFWRPLGMRGTLSQAADFGGHVVAERDFIGRAGDYYREPAFSAGAIRFAAVQQGGIEAVFDETRRYLASLGRTGDAFQRARAGEMAWHVESGRLWMQGAARLYAAADAAERRDAAAAGERRVAHARLMRCAIEASALRVMALSDRAVGARGLLQPEPFERLHRDLTHYLRQPAPDAALVEAGRHVLDDPRPARLLWP